MAKNTQRGLRLCSRCGRGIGVTVYHSTVVEGEYDTSECYVAAVMDSRGWSRELEPEEQETTVLTDTDTL